MAHTLVVGASKCGKTTLCRKIMANLISRGKKVALCDSLGAEFNRLWPPHVFVPPEKLVDFVNAERDYFIFLDECSDYIGHKPETQNIIKKAANFGHYCYPIVQRAHMLHPSSRGNCTGIICFRQCRDDARIIQNNFVRDGLDPSVIERLPPGQYLYSTDPNQPARIGRVW